LRSDGLFRYDAYPGNIYITVGFPEHKANGDAYPFEIKLDFGNRLPEIIDMDFINAQRQKNSYCQNDATKVAQIPHLSLEQKKNFGQQKSFIEYCNRNETTIGPYTGYSGYRSNAKQENYVNSEETGVTGPAGHCNDGIGGVGSGMSQFGGTFRLFNSNGISPKFYEVSEFTGRGWGGGGRGLINTFSATKWGNGIGYGSLGVSLLIGGVDVYSGIQKDGYTYGNNTQMAVAKSSLGITGAWAGAEIGASIGIWFGGVGVVPGVIIGGIIGGVLGGYGGSALGETIVNKTRK
jgi:hypothetical protein